MGSSIITIVNKGELGNLDIKISSKTKDTVAKIIKEIPVFSILKKDNNKIVLKLYPKDLEEFLEKCSNYNIGFLPSRLFYYYFSLGGSLNFIHVQKKKKIV